MNFFARIGKSIKDSYVELMHKVSWPTRKELTNSAVVVMVASVIIALCIFVVDTVFEAGMNLIYSWII
ncbi:preprotein translocase subunit SecE [Porphyromonas circumdentaria]|uniref:Protein translocase subunit SecE n=1 Tax=Porphyromonas circumdentaria TaxID=29524 RepID=A0A1T4M6B7_9PORP|nr:preprotein translocase subunit SecE [Porphyromonas circumdentaria]MBB6275544.1 preprotein translocase subunit SecE [Porphyromonas circumdentaria]MDO4722160.1 preprotein translocase subunit SecE [Porphyromonas circumdentaria]SJZ62539.1 preprotein translocase subunit SecE [Porphyromonas circumdentaria]